MSRSTIRRVWAEGDRDRHLSPVERARLDHIARDVVPDHTRSGVPGGIGSSLRGRALVRRWVPLVAAAEAVGFTVPAAVGAATASASPAVVVPALLAAGLVEGAVLGTGQAIVFRRAVPGMSATRWVAATAAGAALAYLFGLLPSTLGDTFDWTAVQSAIVGVVVGVPVLVSLGMAQWIVLRHHVRDAHRWVLFTAFAWLVGLAAFFGFSSPLWHEGQSLLVTVGIGIGGGLVMAVATAVITGLGLASLLSAHDRAD